MKKKITLEERKRIQLEMMDEIDSFCRLHDIRYSLAFGTLLGAIRHKGYIPWDDDVDLIMPLPDMIRFKKEFRSKKLAYIDLDTKPYYEYHFSRICYLPTYSKIGLFRKSYGVNIDLYPVVGMADTEEGIQAFLKEIEPLYKKRLSKSALRSRLIKILPAVFIPGYKSVMTQFRTKVLFSFPYKESKNYLHAGSVRRVNIFDFDVFAQIIDVDFEGHQYKSIGQYSKYLTQCYGDYMKLPPEDQRHPYHGGDYYWN